MRRSRNFYVRHTWKPVSLSFSCCRCTKRKKKGKKPSKVAIGLLSYKAGTFFIRRRRREVDKEFSPGSTNSNSIQISVSVFPFFFLFRQNQIFFPFRIWDRGGSNRYRGRVGETDRPASQTVAHTKRCQRPPPTNRVQEKGIRRKNTKNVTSLVSYLHCSV